ncbi:MAG: carbon monoxide dehydrogenase subunit G [Chloroflexi bacterium]|nr:carbon monoxide dehydrogenase subunit G [Chloroflexota bacterium]
MNITGSHTVPASRERVWELLHDPDALQRMVPGCQTLDAETPTKFSATLSVGVGPIRGRFSGAVEIEDIAANESYKMTLNGQGPTGFVTGAGMINLSEDGEGTLVEVEADAQVGGTLAQIGSRMVQTAVRMLMGQFFDALSREASV